MDHCPSLSNDVPTQSSAPNYTLDERSRAALRVRIRRALRAARLSLNDDSQRLVSLVFWQPSDGIRNFGDLLSKVLVTQILAQREFSLDDEVRVARRLLAVGSILHYAKDNDVIWGSGVNGKMSIASHQFSRLDVRAVRGPRTAEFLRQRKITVPDVYGDPGLLLPHLFPKRYRPNPVKPYVLVPHLMDLGLVSGWKNVVSPLLGWNRCVEKILEAKLVISSSLHGLIIAEAYGIPAQRLQLSDIEKPFKYEDYYEGTGRTGIQVAKSLEEAIEMKGAPPPKFHAQTLLDAFPFDLWGSDPAPSF